jgi:hypothetical protein
VCKKQHCQPLHSPVQIYSSPEQTEQSLFFHSCFRHSHVNRHFFIRKFILLNSTNASLWKKTSHYKMKIFTNVLTYKKLSLHFNITFITPVPLGYNMFFQREWFSCQRIEKHPGKMDEPFKRWVFFYGGVTKFIWYELSHIILPIFFAKKVLNKPNSSILMW